MFNLAQRYWDWRQVFLINQKLKEVERERTAELRRLYGKYLVQAEKSGESPLYPSSDSYTRLFIDCIDSGVLSVANGRHETIATFGNGYKVSYWNQNKMYAYAQRAVFTDTEGNQISFNKEMPELWCCYMILDKIEEAVI